MVKTRCPAIHRLAQFAVAIAVVALGLVALTPRALARTEGSPPEVLSIHATPAELPSGGGTDLVRATVSNAETCQLELLSSQSFPVVFANNVRPCTSSFTAHVTVGRNPSPVNRTVSFALVARRHNLASAGHFYLMLAARQAPPEVMSVRTSPAQLPAGGGTDLVTATVRNAATCQLELLSSQSFPVVYASNIRPCTTSFTARVAVGRNPSLINRVVTFSLTVRDETLASTRRFYVMLGAAYPPTSATTTPTTTPTTALPLSTTSTTTSTTSTTLTTTVPASSALDAWVVNTLDSDMVTMDGDLQAISNCVQENPSGDGCESYGSELKLDATGLEGGPQAPVAAVQTAWLAVLSDFVNLGGDVATDDYSDAATASTQAEVDLKTLEDTLSANGVPNW
ncbi:MAG TPA: hypothetical protein VL984_17095 [Acidimicrobiales bacterium]|nr:hypothetical protein [Acidimicrobiales bacterium]